MHQQSLSDMTPKEVKKKKCRLHKGAVPNKYFINKSLGISLEEQKQHVPSLVSANEGGEPRGSFCLSVCLSEASRTDFVNEICRSNDRSRKQLRAVLGTRLT